MVKEANVSFGQGTAPKRGVTAGEVELMIAEYQANVESDVSFALSKATTAEQSLSAVNQGLLDNGAKIDERGISVKKYGALSNYTDDDGPAIQRAVDAVSASGGGDVLLMPQHLINTGVIIPNNVKLKSAMFTKIKSTTIKDLSAVFTIAKGSDNVGMERITFDFESTNSCTAILINENVTNLRIDKIDFKNFKQGITQQQNLVRLKTGLTGTISNLSFKNIKCVGDGQITNSPGAGRCIKTDASGVTDLRNYNLNIDNIRIEDCFNVDASGNFIIEDFDPFHFLHTGVNGIINVSNITARNFSKRLMKIQADGVNVTNVIAESTLPVPWLFACMAKNTNISNVTAKGNINKVVEFLDANGVNIHNVNIDSNYSGAVATDVLFAFYNSSNINITQINGNGYGGFLFYGPVTENINIDKVNLTLTNHFFFIQDRDAANSVYTNGKIANVNFGKVTIDVPSTAYNAPLFDFNGLGTVNPITQINFRDLTIKSKQIYQWAMLRTKNVSDVFFDNLVIENKSTLTNPTLISLETGSGVQVRKLKIKGTPTTNQFLLSGTSDLLLTRSAISNAQLSGTGSKLELEKTPATVTYSSGATSAQTTIT